MHFSNKIPMNIRITHIDIYTEQEIIRDGSLLLSDGVIASVCRTSEETADATRVINGTGLSVVPGYIDAHCHGGGGYDCNQGTEEALVKMRTFYGRHGVTTLYPTLAADLLPALEQGLQAVRSVMRQNQAGETEIAGCHLEGPFLNKVYKRSQAEDAILPMTDDHLRFYETYSDVIRRTTIAPEVGHNLDYFPALRAMNIQLSVGHSCAEYNEVLAAIEAGATSVTHLYNAMSQTKKTGPFRIGGVVEAALTQDALYAEIICDGYHLPNELIQIAYRCKGVGRLSVCSDASRAAGVVTHGDTIHSCGETYVVENGVVMNSTRTSLASSITPVDKMVRHLIFNVGLPAIDVVRMTSGTTAKMMGIFDRKGSIAVGKDADINIVDAQFNVVKTFCKGVPVGGE